MAQPADVARTRSSTLVDTGGLFGATDDPLHELVVAARRTRLALRRPRSSSSSTAAKACCPATKTSRSELRAAGVPVLLAVNKTDDRRARRRALELYRLGFDPVIEIAAEHGDGIGDLLDEVVKLLPARTETVK